MKSIIFCKELQTTNKEHQPNEAIKQTVSLEDGTYHSEKHLLSSNDSPFLLLAALMVKPKLLLCKLCNDLLDTSCPTVVPMGTASLTLNLCFSRLTSSSLGSGWGLGLGLRIVMGVLDCLTGKPESLAVMWRT